MKTSKEYWDEYIILKSQVINDIVEYCRYMKPGERIPFLEHGLSLSCDPDVYAYGLVISEDGDVGIDIVDGDGWWSIYTDSLEIVDLISIYEECLSSKK